MGRLLRASIIGAAAVLLIGVGATLLGKFNEAVGWALLGARWAATTAEKQETT